MASHMLFTLVVLPVLFGSRPLFVEALELHRLAGVLSEPSLPTAPLQDRIRDDISQLQAVLELSGEAGYGRFKERLPELIALVENDRVTLHSEHKRRAAAKHHTLSVKAAKMREAGNTSQAAAGQEVLSAKSAKVQEAANTSQAQCVFDDLLFSLTPSGKAELLEQLSTPAFQQELSFVRTGGWFTCAAADQEVPAACHCQGTIRLVNMERVPLTASTVDGAAGSGPLLCMSAIFGVAAGLPKPALDSWRSCECKRHTNPDPSHVGDSADGFHLEKRLTSTSYLQEAWIFLSRLMGRTALLPLGTGDRTYHGVENWAARTPAASMNNFTWNVLERYWITKFIRQAVSSIPGPRCLEWGDPEKAGNGLSYVHLVPACTENYDMQFDFHYWQQAPMHVAGNVIHSDILSLPTVLAGATMNTIFATQVFEHLADPLRAAAALYEALAPGGLLIFTAPQQAQFHKVPHDYMRYTKEGVKYTLVQAGFCVPNFAFAGGGDFIMDIGRDAGLQVMDFSMEEMDGAYQAGYDHVSDGAIAIHALAFKYPHPVCADPTSGWDYMTREGMRA